jgi:tRNA dimethylallyltransferase
MSSERPSPAVLQPLFLAGATAAGKSELAILLAERLNGEIISVDSMQVYRGMDIGTAKPSPEERRWVRHHLIDVVEVNELFDAARFVQLAGAAVAEIQGRVRLPIFCGGTGLYFKAFLEGLGAAPPSDAALRAKLEAAPLPDLLKELAERDPATWEKIDRQNPRRVIRAIEVIRLTGNPFSTQRAIWKRSFEVSPPLRFFVLSRSSEDLRRRIDARVDWMFGRGLVTETEQLLKAGFAENRTATRALGYRQVIEHLNGERSLPETIELVKLRTRQFAKRQLTWFRRQFPATWIQLESNAAPEAAVEHLLRAAALSAR